MAHADFVHLRLHSAFSLSEGAIHIPKLAELCQEHDMPAVAMTDTNNLFGALEFSETLANKGIQPIVGCTLAVTPEQAEPHVHKAAPEPVLLLAQSEAGYVNLMKLVSRAHLETEPTEAPHVRLADLAAFGDGLIALTGGPEGPVGRLLQDGQADKAEQLLLHFAELFPGRLYVEIMRHGLEAEAATEEAFLDLAYAHDLPIVATNEVFFPTQAMYEAHDALICIAEGAYVSETERRRLTVDHNFKPAAEMRERFADLPEAVDNTLVIARRCAYRPGLRDPILPSFAESGAAEADVLGEKAREGLEERLAAHVYPLDADKAARAEAAKPYRERLDYELGIINSMGYPGYFLIVADFIQWAKRQGIPVGPGRGSGAGSVVAWALSITDLDPLRFGLLFERFLNPERVSMPDFDVDFCQERRDEVIHYVQEKYGHGRVAQIITFGKLQARMVLRDVGRVMQMPYGQVDRLCKMVPNNPAEPVTLGQAIEGEPRLQYERENDALAGAVIDRALKLEGLYRHASTHAAGVVIGDRPLDELIPLYRDPRSDMPVTQFNMKWVEKAGLVKFDFLGLKTLTVLARAVELLAEREIKIDLSRIPFDDAKTFALLASGESAGIFQLESSGMRSALKSVKPDKFDDIIALVALFRPGPMDNIPTYANRKHGSEEPDYLHPWLEPILKETYGVIIYQEQVMEVAQVLAGYSLGEADLLRRAMGKKIKAEMDAQRERFVEGAKEKGVDEDKAAFIFELVAKFAGYGFNKSHAAAYALVAYQTAYLKANYPVEFMAALMSLDLHNTDKLASFKKELQRIDIPLLLPDINHSDVAFSVEPAAGNGGLAIRYALAAIRNVGEKAMAALVAERKENGPFADLFDMAERLDPRLVNKRALEGLGAAGAFDSLNPSREQVFDSVELLLKHAHSCADAKASAQQSFFEMAGAEVERPALPSAPQWEEAERLKREYDAVGFYLSAHPLDTYAAMLADHGVISGHEALSDPNYVGQAVKLAGAVDSFSARKSRQGGRGFAYLGLSDASGGYEVLIFSRLLDQARELAERGGPVLVTVTVDPGQDGDSLRLIAQTIEPLDDVALKAATGLRVYVSGPEAFDGVKAALSRHKGGRGRVSLVLPMDQEKDAIVELGGRHKITPPVKNAVLAVKGVVDAREV